MSPPRAPDRSSPPAPGAARPTPFPAFEHRRLGNGVDLLAAPTGPAPLVYLHLVTPGGGRFDPPGRAGLASLTAGLLDEGTRSMTSTEIAARTERLGGSLSTSADWDDAIVAATLLTPHVDNGLELAAEVASAPTFPAEEVERLRRRTLAELHRRRALPGWLADRQLAETVYGRRVYGSSLLGSEESVAAISGEEIVEFYRGRTAAGGWTLVATGGVDPGRLAGRLEEVLPRPLPAAAPASPDLSPPPAGGRRVVVVDRPGAAQTELRIGHAGIARSHPDYLAAGLMNTLLGGKFTSRINLNLRERHGYTYGAYSRFSKRLGPGLFVVATAVANEAAAAAAGEILGEMERVRAEPVAAEELDETRAYLLGVFPYTVQTPLGVASRLIDLAVFSLPDDHYEKLPAALARIGPEEIRRVAREHLRPDSAAIVAAGPAAKLEPLFAALGEVEVRTV